MTKEDKELLLKDLSARLPYGVICNDNRHGSGRVTNIDITPDESEQGNSKVILYYFDFDEYGELKNCKPYLRPMSSMTADEEIEFMNLTDNVVKIGNKHYAVLSLQQIDWHNAHHFDYRGLIEKGLAIEAKKGMYDN